MPLKLKNVLPTWGAVVSPIEAHIGDLAGEPDRWTGSLGSLDPSRLHRTERELFALAKKARDVGDTNLEALYAVLGSIASYYFKPDEPLDPYGPQMVSGESRTAMPEDLRDQDLYALQAMLPHLAPPALRARAADVLWIRRRDSSAAMAAVEAYVEASRQHSSEWAHDAIEQIQRAMQITAQLGKGGVQPAERVVARIHEMLAHDDFEKVGQQGALVRTLTDRGETENLDERLDVALQQGASLSAEDPMRATPWFELAATICSALGRDDDARAHRIVAAGTWVSAAEAEAASEPPSHLCAAGLLESGIKQLRAIGGMRDRVDELHAKMLEWQELAAGEMHAFSTEVDITDLVTDSMSRVGGKPLPDAIVALAYVYGYRDTSQVREEVVKLMDEHPLQYFMSRAVLDEKGRVIARPPAMTSSSENEAEAAIQAEMFSHTRSTMGLVVQGGINPARRVIVAEHPLSLALLMELLAPSSFIPAGHEPTYVKGLWAGFNGDFATAAAILAPELENSIRAVMDQAGATLPHLDAQVTHEVRPLGAYLYDPNAEQVFGKDKLFLLRAVLCNDFGANLRDRVAHGLMTYPALQSTESAFMWWLALRLAVEPLVRIVGTDEASDQDSDATPDA